MKFGLAGPISSTLALEGDVAGHKIAGAEPTSEMKNHYKQARNTPRQCLIKSIE